MLFAIFSRAVRAESQEGTTGGYGQKIVARFLTETPPRWCRWGFIITALPVGVFCFVFFMYWGSRLLNPWSKPGDCTKWIKFRDPADEKHYAGRRIDIETMYEMYFDEKLDFKEKDLMKVFAER